MHFLPNPILDLDVQNKKEHLILKKTRCQHRKNGMSFLHQSTEKSYSAILKKNCCYENLNISDRSKSYLTDPRKVGDCLYYLVPACRIPPHIKLEVCPILVV